MNFYLYSAFFLITILIHLFFHSKKADFIFKNGNFFRNVMIGMVSFFLIGSLLYQLQAIDIYLFKTAGNYLRQKIDYYWIDSDHRVYPFFPFLIFLFAGFDWISETIPALNFMLLMKLLLLFPLFYLCMWLLTSSKKKRNARKKVALFLSSPITYSVFFYHAQIDSIVIVFYLLSLKYLDPNLKQTKNVILSAINFTISVLSKTWSILFAPLILWKYKKNWKIYVYFLFVGLTLLGNVFIYTRFVEGSSVRFVLPAILKPGGPIGDWGITLLPIVQEITVSYKLPLYGFLVFIGYVLIIKRNYSLLKSSALFILWLYIAAIHWAVQYVFWFLPFLYFYKESFNKKTYILLTASAILHTFVNYANVSVQREVLPVELITYSGIVLWIMYVKVFTEEMKK